MKAQVTQVTCDLCGHGGPYADVASFLTVGTVDLCKWCSDPNRKAWLESGGHRVTFDGLSWECSCGARSWQLAGFVRPEVAAAIPHIPNATAHLHISTSPVVVTA